MYKTSKVKDWSYNGDSRTISGYGAIFGNRDKAHDILVPGCFAKSIRERGPQSKANDKIIMLWMHKMDQPIGKITRLVEDDKGLYFEAVIDEIETGDRAIKQLESGTLNQFSIGYNYVADQLKYDEALDAFLVKEVVLYEISVVSIGCNGETEYTGLKSIEEKEGEMARLQKELNEVIRELPITSKQKINEVLSKAISLSKIEPAKPLEEKEADSQKSMFHISKQTKK